jgi:signal transduction histidine kinase
MLWRDAPPAAGLCTAWGEARSCRIISSRSRRPCAFVMRCRIDAARDEAHPDRDAQFVGASAKPGHSITARSMPEIEQPWLIAFLSPSGAHKRAALAVSTFLLVAFVISIASANIALPQLHIYIPLVATVMFLNDLMTASLLLALFSVVRSRALLLLANGYLFTALVVAVYGLVWPGAFHPTGLFGAGTQTRPWLYLVWHAGLPTSVIVYALLRSKEHTTLPVARAPVLKFIFASIACTVLTVGGLTWFLTWFRDILPVLVTAADRASEFSHFGTGVVLFVSIGALALQWRRRQQSVLDLWLSVVALAWLLGSIMLIAIRSRYDVAWYATPGFSVVAATLVLLLLLSESLKLHAQLAVSVLAQRREREGRRLSMDAMSAAMAHEVRQPLGAIVTSVDSAMRWLDKTPPNVGKAHDSLKRIANEARRAERIIQSVRSMFSNVGHGGDAQPRAPVDTNELIRESIAMLRGELEAAKIISQLELAKELPPVSADSGQLQQVLLNLITNATEAMHGVTDRARVLKLTSKAIESNVVAVSVEDTGTGIDPRAVDCIFEAFFTTKSNGMGLGLAICQSIVESHGGTVTAEANVPHGSILRINLPSSQMLD